MNVLRICALAILLSGCRSGRAAFPDLAGTVVYTATGCAFYVTDGIGDLNGLSRYPSADLSTCKDHA